MDSPTYVTLSAQMALQSQLAVVANNVANANKAGFKADRMLFQSVMTPLETPGKEVAFVQDRATYIDRTAGQMQTTDNPLDVAISGDGLIGVQTPQGRQYTRDGKLQISPDGTLVNDAGQSVLSGDGSPIQIPNGATDIKITGDGTISVRANGQVQDIGQLGLFRAGNATGVRKSGNGMLDGQAGAIAPVDPGDTTTRFVQGAVENSTVQPVVELTRMTDLTQAYERLQKLISDDNDRESKMIAELGKTN